MRVQVSKTIIYKLDSETVDDHIYDDKDYLREIIGAIEGMDVEVHEVFDQFIVTGSLEDTSNNVDLMQMLVDRLKTLHILLENSGDDEHCDISLVFADPCTEVYVCWNHRRVWVIDTTYVGSRLGNTPKNCKECQHLVELAKEKKRTEQEIQKLAKADKYFWGED